MTYELGALEAQTLDVSNRREWLLTNGIGGFAMGTVSGINTRRYHGHLVAALHPPTDRMVLVANVEAFVETDGEPIGLSSNQYHGTVYPDGYRRLTRFRAGSFVEWTYGIGGGAVRKRLAMHPGVNAATLAYENAGSRRILLVLRPLCSHKPYHHNFRYFDHYPENLRFERDETRLSHGETSLFMRHPGALRIPFAGWYYRFEAAREFERGLDASDDLFCPCELRYELAPGQVANLVFSVDEPAAPIDFGQLARDEEPWEMACRHFLVKAPTRRTILAGYPWFTDWGRDTMIALPGICLSEGRPDFAREILIAYAERMDQGLIPNRFVEDQVEPDYNTVDATLWFAQAAWLTLEAEWDEAFARTMLDKLTEIIRWHQQGTRYGIRVDPEDGLLTQGEPGWQLTWMDAKIGDWVVTPRYGKPIEVNGLWVNAVRIAEQLANRLGLPTNDFARAAERAESHFARKFWSPRHGWYFDTIDPYDAQLRPNQVIAMGLPFGPATGPNAVQALEAVERELLTPVGLRTLAPFEIHYQPRFEGPMFSLDSAYHQGTVWPWLLGPYVDAVLRLTGDRERARRAIEQSDAMLNEFGMGGVAEVYDGDAPHRPSGCPWQAWSVSELNRVRKMLTDQ